MTIEIPEDTLTEHGDIYRTLEHIVETIETIYASAGVLLPARAYPAVGDVGTSIALDCEQFTVNFIQAYLGTPGQPDVQPLFCDLTMSGDFVAQVTRCVPGMKDTGRGAPKPPKPEDILESTRVQAVDAQLLLEAAHTISSLAGVSATVVPSGVTGGYQSMMLNLSMSMFRWE